MTTIAPPPHSASRAFRLQISDADRAALWAMSPEQRVVAMWADQLSHGQLLAWTRARPDEVPRLAGEFAWLVMLTPDWAEPAEQHRDNIVHLPHRSDTRAAA